MLSISAIVATCFLVHHAYGLKCFECTANQKNCDIIISNKTNAVDCKLSIFTLNFLGNRINEDYECLKTVEKNSTDKIYTRRCALRSEINEMCKNNTEHFQCHHCNQDYCNSTSIIKIDFICYLLLLINLIIYVF